MGAVLAVILERLDGTVDVLAGFFVLETSFWVVFLTLAMVLCEVSERESSTRGRTGGMLVVVLVRRSIEYQAKAFAADIGCLTKLGEG